jgi:hypothetical protein
MIQDADIGNHIEDVAVSYDVEFMFRSLPIWTAPVVWMTA